MELLLVILMLGLLVAFVYPDLEAEQKRRSLVESADKLRSLIVMTHARAMQDGIKYRIEFPGTPDPLDRHAEKEVATPQETLQPIVKRQIDAISNPEMFGDDVEEPTLRAGTRCVAVLPWSAEMYCSNSGQSRLAGPDISSEGQTTFVPLTLNPDGTCDKVAFVLTDLPPDVELQEWHVGHILYVVVDPRTGQTWIQRAWRVEECELMAEYEVSPVLRMDYTKPDLITEANILQPPSKWP